MQLRRKPVLIGLAIIVAISGATSGTVLYEYIQDHKALPPVPSHTDITNQPMRTFEQSLATKTPADVSNYSDSSCAKLSPTWVADENAQQGVAMTVKDWKKLNLQGAAGSALWLNKTSGGCGDTIDIHASLYGSSADTFHTGTRSI